MYAIDVSNLSFGFHKNEPILRNLNMKIPSGSIYGFLGANGAGKSTTIRNILGLLDSQQGSVKIFGESLAESTPQIFSQIGSLIEEPSLYTHLNAYDHLKIGCHYFGLPHTKIDNTLELVGLLSAKKKKVKNFSMGMKQRLGLAMALVHDPNLIILDEPSNGLDPKGMVEMRQTLINLKDMGKTIMLSSHLLAEIEKTVSHIGIIQHGKLAFEGTLSELTRLKSTRNQVNIKVGDYGQAQEILKSSFKVTRLETNKLNVGIKSEEDIPKIAKALVEANINLYEIEPVSNNLEGIFTNMTENSKPETQS